MNTHIIVLLCVLFNPIYCQKCLSGLKTCRSANDCPKGYDCKNGKCCGEENYCPSTGLPTFRGTYEGSTYTDATTNTECPLPVCNVFHPWFELLPLNFRKDQKTMQPTCADDTDCGYDAFCDTPVHHLYINKIPRVGRIIRRFCYPVLPEWIRRGYVIKKLTDGRLRPCKTDSSCPYLCQKAEVTDGLIYNFCIMPDPRIPTPKPEKPKPKPIPEKPKPTPEVKEEGSTEEARTENTEETVTNAPKDDDPFPWEYIAIGCAVGIVLLVIIFILIYRAAKGLPPFKKKNKKMPKSGATTGRITSWDTTVG